MADTKFAEGFIAQTQKMIAELQAELAPYEDGSAEARSAQDDQRTSTTRDRITQIKQEIAALEDSLARHGETNASLPASLEAAGLYR